VRRVHAPPIIPFNVLNIEITEASRGPFDEAPNRFLIKAVQVCADGNSLSP